MTSEDEKQVEIARLEAQVYTRRMIIGSAVIVVLFGLLALCAIMEVIYRKG